MTANISADVQALKESVAVIANNQEHLSESNRETNNVIRELSSSLTTVAKEMRENTASNRHLSKDVQKLDGRFSALETRVHECELQVKSNTDFSVYIKWAVRGAIGFAISIVLLIVGTSLNRSDDSEELKSLLQSQGDLIERLSGKLENSEAGQ